MQAKSNVSSIPLPLHRAWFVPVAVAALGLASVAYGANEIRSGLRVGLDQIYRSEFGPTLGGVITGIEPAPGGGLLVSESNGTLFHINEGAVSPEAVLLDIVTEVAPAASGGQGLLSFNVHPEFMDCTKAGYRKLYTYHSIPDPEDDDGMQADLNNGLGAHIQYEVITEWTMSADFSSLDLGSRREVVRLGHPGQTVHSGGSLVFDNDNYLLLSHGVSPGYFDEAQDLSNTLGAAIRIDPLHPNENVTSDQVSANGKYRIPLSNPFVGNAEAIPEVYAYGLRNPFRMSFDPVSEMLFVGDVGQGAREEVSLVIAGGNNGWPKYEGESLYSNSTTLNEAGPLVEPLVTYNHTEGRSVTGGFVYRGSAIPELYGKYVFGDLIQGSGQFFTRPGRLFYFDPFDENGDVISDASEIVLYDFYVGPEDSGLDIGVTTFGLDADGEILVGGNAGGREYIYRLVNDPTRLPGDFNGDGTVNLVDYTVWRSNLGSGEPLSGNGVETGDSAGIVDAEDYVLWKEHFGDAAGGFSSASVPEPGGVWLFGVAATGTGLFFWRRPV